MRTPSLRNVPDDVLDRLQRLADLDGTSLGAVAARELSEISRRTDDAALLATLPDLVVDTAVLLGGLDEARASR